jgi:hypothetical protein
VELATTTEPEKAIAEIAPLQFEQAHLEMRQLPLEVAENVWVYIRNHMLVHGNDAQRMFAVTMDQLGGFDKWMEWGETAPHQFMQVFVTVLEGINAQQPAALNQSPGQGGGGNVLQLHLHQSLGPGPLDAQAAVVAEQ